MATDMKKIARKGGLAVKKKYGLNYFKKIGKRGGKASAKSRKK